MIKEINITRYRNTDQGIADFSRALENYSSEQIKHLALALVKYTETGGRGGYNPRTNHCQSILTYNCNNIKYVAEYYNAPTQYSGLYEDCIIILKVEVTNDDDYTVAKETFNACKTIIERSL